MWKGCVIFSNMGFKCKIKKRWPAAHNSFYYIPVKPVKAEAQALTKIISPKNTWTSRYEPLK